MKRVGIVVAVFALATVGLTAPPSVAPAQAATSVVADWQMDEPAGASVMVDSSGNGIDGQISPDAASVGLTSNGAYYTWAERCPACLPVQEARVVQVPDDDRLDIPDPSATYTLEFRFRTTRPFGNYMQKGQSTTKGGQIKVQGPGGNVQCLFKGADGTRVGTGSPAALNDGQWHTVMCVHTATQVKQYVDGVRVAIKNGATGPINNKQPLTIGGKHNCDQVTITCDYFSGDIDYVRVSTEGASGNQSPTATFTSSCVSKSCSFDSSGSTDPDGTIESYAWAFGDGATSTAASPTHVYSASGTYQVTLTVTDNSGAKDTALHTVSIAATPPGQPRNASAEPADTSAKVTWTAPTSAGSDPITQYVATSTPDGKTCTTATLGCTVNGLTNGRSYTFVVVAQSDAGSGAPSSPTNAVVPAGSARPPSVVTAKAGNGRATLTWTAGKPNGSSITSYVVTRLPGGQTKTLGAAARSTVVTGLRNGHRYRFTVAATNDVGTGPATTSNTVRPAGAPGRVQHLSAKPARRAALLAWSAAPPNGAPVLRYSIVTSRGQHRVVRGTVRQLRFDRLKAGSSYRFRIRAINSVGAGSWSSWTKSITVR
jgi:PKD repeat protein